MPGKERLEIYECNAERCAVENLFWAPPFPPPGKTREVGVRMLGIVFALAGTAAVGRGGLRTWEVTANGPKWMAGMIGFIYSYREIIMRDVGDKGFWCLFCTGDGGL